MVAVGIDVSKSKSMAAVLNSTGEVLAAPFEFHHVEDEMDRFVSYLNSLKSDVKIVMEATGHYHLPVLKKLLDAGLFVSVLNPYLMKKYGIMKYDVGKRIKRMQCVWRFMRWKSHTHLWSKNMQTGNFCLDSTISAFLPRSKTVSISVICWMRQCQVLKNC